MSYSQYDEEQYILRALTNIPIGRFLDIGAWHPTVFSNTRALYEKGWGGVMIEPSPGPMTGLVKEYGNSDRVVLVMAPVTLHKDGFIKLHVSDDAISTTDEAHYEKWKNVSGYSGSIYTHVITINGIVQMFGDNFDFINIDVEGYSAQLFLDIMDFTRLRPKCFCIEYDERGDEIIAKASGYTCLYKNGTNMVIAR